MRKWLRQRIDILTSVPNGYGARDSTKKSLKRERFFDIRESMTTFDAILTLYIERYCNDKKIEPTILIKKLKKNKISKDQALDFSLTSYRSFCRLADFVMKEK